MQISDRAALLSIDKLLCEFLPIEIVGIARPDGTTHYKDKNESKRKVILEEIAALKAKWEFYTRVEECANMKFIGNDGNDTYIPFTQYRYCADGLILNWEDHVNEIMKGKPEDAPDPQLG